MSTSLISLESFCKCAGSITEAALPQPNGASASTCSVSRCGGFAACARQHDRSRSCLGANRAIRCLKLFATLKLCVPEDLSLAVSTPLKVLHVVGGLDRQFGVM